MNSHRRSRLPLALTGGLLALASIGLVRAADLGSARSYAIVQSKVTVAGTSNLHEWSVTADALHAELAVPGGFLDGAGGAPTGTFSLAAHQLRSDKDRMNKLMWEALKVDQHPTLQFELKGARLKSASGAELALEGDGVLELAGVQRPVTVPLTVRRDGERLIVQGELPVQMSDYGISPPTAMFGALKTGNKVVITISATLVPSHA